MLYRLSKIRAFLAALRRKGPGLPVTPIPAGRDNKGMKTGALKTGMAGLSKQMDMRCCPHFSQRSSRKVGKCRECGEDGLKKPAGMLKYFEDAFWG